jgi:hypothetical protein
MLQLSLRDRDRLVLLRQVAAKELTVRRGAERAGLSVRHFRRLVRRFEREGDRAVIHRARGRPPNNGKGEDVRQRVLERAREGVFHDFGPTLLAEHLARDPQIGPLSAHTLRRWLIEAGLWEVRPRRLRHRRRRERRASRGELVQMDTSIHPWLEERSQEEIVLIAMVDDATSDLFAGFVPRDTGAANRQLIVDYLGAFGRPRALYVDRAAHFRQPRGRRVAEDRAHEHTQSLIRKALAQLGCEVILAHSPQAKGRVERNFRTLQDRLLKEMRVRSISTLEAANRYLKAEFIPFWNERFTTPPADPVDAHLPLPEDVDLGPLFAETETRVIGSDFTIRYKNQRLQIPRPQARATMPGKRLVVERRLDGTTRFRWKDRYLELLPAARGVPSPNGKRNGKKPTKKPKTPWKPAPDHPWRRRLPVSEKALRQAAEQTRTST